MNESTNDSMMTGKELRQVLNVTSADTSEYIRAKQELDGRLARWAFRIALISAGLSLLALVTAFW